MRSADKLVLFCIVFSGIVLPGTLALSQDILQPLTDDSSGMSVTTHKIKKDKTESKPIRLISPSHNSQFTPGTIEFSWKLNSKIKEKKVTFVLEKLENHRMVSQSWKGETLSLNLKTGTYRWQVVSANPKAESHWRTFEVISASDGPLKNVPELTVDNPVSNFGQNDGHVEQYKSTDANAGGSQGELDDNKIQQYKQEKQKAEQLAKDLKNQLEVVKRQRVQALQAAKEEVAQLKAARLAKHEAEKAAREKAARIEAERQAKIRAEKAEKEKIAKLRAKQVKEIRLAKEKADQAAKKLMAMIKKENEAKLEAERATRELAGKVEAERQTTVRAKQIVPKQEPAQEPEEATEEEVSLPPPPPTRVPSSNPPPASRRSGGDDLKWSDE